MLLCISLTCLAILIVMLFRPSFSFLLLIHLISHAVFVFFFSSSLRAWISNNHFCPVCRSPSNETRSIRFEIGAITGTNVNVNEQLRERVAKAEKDLEDTLSEHEKLQEFLAQRDHLLDEVMCEGGKLNETISQLQVNYFFYFESYYRTLISVDCNNM